MIRIKNTSKEQWWVSEKYLEEMKRIDDTYKGRWLKKLKALIKGKAEEPSKPTR